MKVVNEDHSGKGASREEDEEAGQKEKASQSEEIKVTGNKDVCISSVMV